MTRQIDVRPAAAGWAVHLDDGGALAFAGGGAAEDAARKLAARYAALGQGVEIRIWLRDGALAGRFYAPPSPNHEAVAA